MPRAQYYASTSRIFKDVANYFLNPTVRAALQSYWPKEHHRASADVAASAVTTASYLTMTAMFHGLEANAFSNNVRTAVAAELGKSPDELKFSDFLDSQNTIVRQEAKDMQNITRLRYATDLSAALPIAMLGAGKIFPKLGEAYKAGRLETKSPSPNAKFGERFMHSFNVWDSTIFAVKSAYWAYETFLVDKTAHYEVVKLQENIVSVGKQFKPNDLIALINRNRHDLELENIQPGPSRDAMWKVLEHLTDKLNNAPHFAVPELVYLVGMDKLSIFEKDKNGNEIMGTDGHAKPDEKAVKQALKAIDEVAEKGLKGIMEEQQKNRGVYEQSGQLPQIPGYDLHSHEGLKSNLAPKKFTERFGRNIKDAHHHLTTSIVPRAGGFTEYISTRDQAEGAHGIA